MVRMQRAEGGFSIIESMMAATILLIAIVLTVTPLAVSMRAIDRAKDTTIAENIAQARIEEVRSLRYNDVGNVGFEPNGIISRTVTQTVSGRDFTVLTTVEYAGSLTGLNVVAQGGDGVQGFYDIGVNYKSVVVTVSPVVGSAKPVTMETIISPPTIAAQEQIAVVQVDVVLHEPYDSYGDAAPTLQIVGAKTYVSANATLSQYFVEVDFGTYNIELFSGSDWLIDPVSVSSGATSVDAVGGWNARRTIQLYQPASLAMTITDKATGSPIADAVLTVEDLSSGWTTTGVAGEYDFSNLVPDRYRVTAAAGGYAPAFVEIDVPGSGGASSVAGTLELEVPPYDTVNYTFTVSYGGQSDYVINGAEVTVTHPTLGSWVGHTDETGNVTLNIPANMSSLVATATTTWGHGSVVWRFRSTPSAESRELKLTKPLSTDRFRLRYGPIGPNGFYEYRVGGTAGTWIRIPANSFGNVSFMVVESYGLLVEVTAYCGVTDYPASPLSTASTTLNNRNKTWSVSSSC